MTSVLAEVAVAIGRSADLSIVVKATVGVMLGLGATRIARRARASTRHLLLVSTFGGLLSLPLAVAVVPGVAIQVPVSGVGEPLGTQIEGPHARPSKRSPADVVTRSTAETGGSSRVTGPTLMRTAWLSGAMLLLRGDGSPIIMAAREGHADVVQLLLNRAASIDQMAPDDENALIQASGAGHLHVVKLLIARGADVNARAWADGVFGSHDRPSEWRTPLTMARRGRHDVVIAYLLSAGARD